MTYLPDRPWALIKEFYFMKPMLDAKKLLAIQARLMKAAFAHIMPEKDEWWWKDFEQRSHPHTLPSSLIMN